ncbi:hypothetical protein Nepgr_017551 [Nepenthes gracilis]|uniref:Uncharacterized protein n=1 Tax=Nepenthes gracilis TaxID=150966 RepID=A0AAD3SPJ7_NEPGR|nr:hypothetical protein Nepgr_017551 [Nepenthes gracilis]
MRTAEEEEEKAERKALIWVFYRAGQMRRELCTINFSPTQMRDEQKNKTIHLWLPAYAKSSSPSTFSL